MNWSEALAYCDGLSWGGYDDWRLPDTFALQSIVDFNCYGPSIDINAFPETSNNVWWSSSLQLGVSFGGGHLGYVLDGYIYPYTRCVRSELMGQPSRFVRDTSKEAYPMVYDSVTQLTWQGCSGGQEGKDCTGDAMTFTWKEALEYCASLHWGDDQAGNWRLPSVVELQSIVIANKKDSLAIDSDSFPATQSKNYYWSSSSYESHANSAWIVFFGSGGWDESRKDNNNYYARCVQSGL
jgi:hypothetical protein